ncbi:CHASE2 domain-containing protein [Synechococcus sp. UW179A]|uniref:CHASE2 domain-containing protein n=1 Tax=Synechococcus sp. UW179A TaxID=2575510 RepID=UPI000E0FF3A8|nr:CHASE2 domain-containing protein [Synechococcus sp. UW179A]
MNWPRPIRQVVPYALAIGLLVGLQHSPLVETANLLVYDLAINLRNRANDGQAKDLNWPITVVGINEADIKLYGWPLDDTLLCRALKQLDALGASVIGLDLYRDQAKPCLQDEIQRNPRLISIRNEVDGITAIPGAPARQQAFNDLVMDADRVVRRDLIHVGGQEEALRSLPLRLLETASQTRDLDRQLEQLNEHHWLKEQSGGYQGVDAAGYQAMLPVYPPGRYPSLDLTTLLNGEVPREKINGRVVLVGSVAPSLRDLFEIPHSRFVSSSEFFAVPGVELHAQRLEALQRLLQSRTPEIVTIQGWQRSLLVLAMVLLGVLIAERPARIRRSLMLLTAAVILLIGTVFGLTLSGIWIGLTMPLSGLVLISGSGILRRGVQSQRHQQDMRRLLGQTSSPAVAQQLWDQREDLIKDGRFTGREQQVTVLFSDTCSFTSVSEQLTPSELMQWLNRGMCIGVDAVTSRGGIVNKFTGDGMLAVFGAPVSKGPTMDACHAVTAALAIQEQISKLNEDLAKEGQPALRMRIGIHSGPVLTGSLGSSNRLEYAVIGDTVNCASRLEGLEKDRHEGMVRILVSGETQCLLEALPAHVTSTSWGTVLIKGRLEPLDVIELRSTEP